MYTLKFPEAAKKPKNLETESHAFFSVLLLILFPTFKATSIF